MSMVQPSSEKMTEHVTHAIKHWHRDNLQTSPLLDLRVVQKTLPTHQQLEPNDIAKQLAIKTALQETLDKLKGRHPELHQVVQDRFIDGRSLKETSERLHRSVPTVARNQNEAFRIIAALLTEMENQLAKQIAAEQELDLPQASYQQLFGVADIIETVSDRLLTPDNHFMAALIGIGGIGKSSVAREIARRVIGTLQYKRVVWVNFSQDATNLARSPESTYAYVIAQLANLLVPNLHTMPLEQQEKVVKQILHKAPHLIVIDNLEVESEIEPLVEKLNNLTNPSKILFGTRARPFQSGVFCQDMHEIPYPDARDFINFLTKESNADPIPEELFSQIYEAIGGNPLALKLVVSLLQHLPFSELLPTIQNGRQESYQMYTRIYKRIWRLLSENGQELLLSLSMGKLDVGIDEAGLKAMSGLEDEPFWAAVRELRFNSLLTYQGTAANRTYSIHRLTETFVLNDVVKLFEIG